MKSSIYANNSFYVVLVSVKYTQMNALKAKMIKNDLFSLAFLRTDPGIMWQHLQTLQRATMWLGTVHHNRSECVGGFIDRGRNRQRGCCAHLVA